MPAAFSKCFKPCVVTADICSASRFCCLDPVTLQQASKCNIQHLICYSVSLFLLVSESHLPSRPHYFSCSWFSPHASNGSAFFTLSARCVTLSFLAFLILSFQLECNPLLELHSHIPTVLWPLQPLSQCRLGAVQAGPSAF